MAVRVSCPHCRTPCVVAEQHLGVLLKCGRCGRTFTTRGDPKATMRVEPSPLVRLDIGAAESPRRGREPKDIRFLVQHLVRCNLDDRHELAVLVVADGGQVIPAAAAALAPLLGKVLNSAGKDTADAAETITAACKNVGSTVAVAVAVIWNGLLSIGGVGDCPIYHHSGGRLKRVRHGPMKLSAGDWLAIICDSLNAHLDEDAVQSEIAAARSSAVELAPRLVERVGSHNCTVVVVRGY